ncbi:SDR family oxidoreductase [Fodinibius halophilus]|uniref:SDR family oxidoreductase n=1 Tax=Fodinibius halophilus TaxID=1736908 RepID=A0A6M1SUF8_9BACT|nr:SDR family oxidoreductase [Fodinibius halophilus]NGP87598.1 SDR family oxidoreductase [Fodinibius halophilus]
MDLTNKLCVVTGANSGIGKETARAFAKQQAYVIMVCRNEKRAKEAKHEIIAKTNHTGVEIMLADLALQHDVRELANKITQKYEKVDLLVNNAGLIPDDREETIDGIEKTLAVNHLAPFLLTNLLGDHLKKATEARVVNVSSEVHRLGAKSFDLDNLQLRNDYSPMKAYGISKLCNIMFTHELSKRWADSTVTTNSLHPGVVRTQLAEEASWFMKLFYFIGKPFMRSPKSGAKTSIYLSTSDEVADTSGKYFRNRKEIPPADIAYDDALTNELWERSAELTGLS